MAKEPTKIEEGDRDLDEPLPPIDDSHIQGGHGNPTPPPDLSRSDDEPTMVSVVVGGVAMDLPEDQAALVQAEQEAARQVIQGLQVVEPSSDDRLNDDDPTAADLLFTDPAAAIAKITKEVTDTVRGEYRQDQASKDFWGDFYRENNDLREEDHIVRAVLDRDMDTLKNLTGKGGRDKLAELTKGEILRITEKHQKGKKKKADDTTTLEGGGADDAPTSPDNPPKEPSGRLPTLGDAIKERRLNRARAARGGQPPPS